MSLSRLYIKRFPAEGFLHTSGKESSRMLLKRNSLRWFCLLLLVASHAVMTHEVNPVLRVLFQEDNGLFAYKTNNSDSAAMRGYGFKAADWVLQYAKFRYEWDTFPTYSFGKEFVKQLASDSTGGKIGTFETTDFDVLVMAFGFTVGTSRLGESTAMESMTMSMILPYPQEKPKVWSFAYPFSTKVWVCILLSATLVGGCVKAINLLATPEETLHCPFMFILQVAVGQGGSCSSPRFNLRILAATWSVAALVLSNVYLSLLVSLFSSPYRVPLAENLQQVLDNGLAPVLPRDSFVQLFFQDTPPDSIYSRINDKSRESVVCTNGNYTTSCVDWLLETKNAVAFMAYGEGEISYEDLVSRSNCRLTSIALQGISTAYSGIYMMPKGHPNHKQVSLGMLRLREYGLQAPMKKHENAFQKCTCCNWKQDRPPLSKLRVLDLAGIFGILGVGYGLAFLVFLLEVLTGRKPMSWMNRFPGRWRSKTVSAPLN